MTTERMRARAVFSTADFELLKEAIGELITKVSVDDVKLSRLSALYHRLGRLGCPPPFDGHFANRRARRTERFPGEEKGPLVHRHRWAFPRLADAAVLA